MKQSSRGTFPIRTLAAAAVLAGLAITACSTSSQPTGPHPSTQPPASATSASPPASPSSTPPVHPIKCAGGWQTGPATVTHQVPVPPVPIATAIRTGSHPDCTFDRLVVDFNGKVPGYKIRFVPKVVRDGSGQTVTIPGTTFLEIVFNPAQGHSNNGAPTLPFTVQSVGDQMLKSYVVAGDFEGYLTVALGLNGGTKYRVGELGSRVYIDVAW